MVEISKKIVGKKVKIVQNTANHHQPIGSIGTVLTASGGYVRLKEFPSLNFYAADVELCPATREEIEKEISSLQDKIKSEQEKLDFMTENKLNEFDETQFKVFQTLKTLDNKELSTIERSKIIASLIEK